MSLWTVLITGLVAGGASCAAVQGGLLTGLVARRRAPAETPAGPVEDTVPVAMFLAGKVISHGFLGAALGWLGGAAQLEPRTRGSLQIAAGVVMFVLALDLLGVKAVRRAMPAAPASWSRLVRRSGRWGNGLAPGLLGFATVLIPCGVTLSMMFLAVASGSPLSGAAILVVFVLGTAPLFAVIGYAARRSTRWLRGRLGVLAGVAVLVAALLSVNAGLVLRDSSFTLAGALRSVTGSESAPAVAAPPAGADGIQRVVVDVHETWYSPSSVTARAGVPTELIMRTDGNRGCTSTLVMGSLGVQRLLPFTGDTRIELGMLDPGTYRYTCGMGMYSGSIEMVA